MKSKPKVALLRGPFLNAYEMQTYAKLMDRFDLTAFVPHETYFDVSTIEIAKESLWCPIAGKTPFEREKRKWQALRDTVTGRTHSFCGLADRLRGFDLYHVMDQHFCFSYEAALAKRRYGGKLVVTEFENIPHLNEHKAMERRIKRTVKEQADLFLAMSEGARKALLEEGVPESRIKPLRGAVDTEKFKPGPKDLGLAREWGLPPKAFTVLYVGRLAASKGVFVLLEAFERLAAVEKNIFLLLVGKDEEGIGEWVKKRNMEGRVRLAGFVPYEKITAYFRLSDLFVLPSLPTKGWVEQFGYVLVEAMACGVPVLGSDCGAIPEVVGEPRRIFKAGSADELSRLILGWKRRPQAIQRAKARRRAVENFSSEKLSRSIAEIYSGLLAPGSVMPKN